MYKKQGFLGLFICELFSITNQSIVGITYRDKFDFEERNRHDVCNPLYWHPLHMPDHCIAIYEKLIRNKLYNTQPYKYQKMQEDEQNLKELKRLLKTRRRQQSSSDSSDSECSDETSKYTRCSSSDESQSDSEQSGKSKKFNYFEYVTPNVKEPPYQRMLNEIREDVMTLPAMPVVGLLPPLGLATIYRQPVSKKTEKTIKKIAGAYASAARDSYAETAKLFAYPPPPPFPKPCNNTTTEPDSKDNTINNGPNENKKTFEINKDPNTKMKFEINKMMEPIMLQKLGNKPSNLQENKKHKVETKKIINGNMVTYIQQRVLKG